MVTVGIHRFDHERARGYGHIIFRLNVDDFQLEYLKLFELEPRTVILSKMSKTTPLWQKFKFYLEVNVSLYTCVSAVVACSEVTCKTIFRSVNSKFVVQ